MKKTIVLFLSVIVFGTASAQVDFGVKGGVNLANLTLSGNTSTLSLSANTNFNGGLVASLPITDELFVQPEVVYSGQGAKYALGGETIKLNYAYINVPVLVKYQHSSGLFAETGPQVGFLVSAKEKTGSLDEDVKSSLNSVDFSWAFGLGFKIPDVNLGVDLRYNLGLTNIIKDSGDGTAKNSVFQFGLFYMFGLGDSK